MNVKKFLLKCLDIVNTRYFDMLLGFQCTNFSMHGKLWFVMLKVCT